MVSEETGAVTCPDCGREVKMGLPRSATLEAVRATPDATLEESFLDDDPRHKRRRNVCPEGHELYIYFEF